MNANLDTHKWLAGLQYSSMAEHLTIFKPSIGKLNGLKASEWEARIRTPLALRRQLEGNKSSYQS